MPPSARRRCSSPRARRSRRSPRGGRRSARGGARRRAPARPRTGAASIRTGRRSGLSPVRQRPRSLSNGFGAPRLGGAGRRAPRRLPQPYILFESNFNGPAEIYIDAFALVVPLRLGLLWGGAYGYPGARSTERFRSFIMRHKLDSQHYWSAYPQASSAM